MGRPVNPTAVSTGAVSAEAAVSAEWTRRGTRIGRLRCEPPIVLRRTGAGTLHLVSVGGGPVAGDHLRLWLQVGPGATLTVHQLAACVALPAPHPRGPSRVEIDVDVEDGGALTWLGAPTVAVRGCEHDTVLRVRLGGDARLCWRDEIVAGRFDQPSGRVRARVAVDRDGMPLLRSDTTVGDSLWSSAALGGGARVFGSCLIAGETPRLHVPASGQVAVLCPIEGFAVVTALGDTHPETRLALTAALGPLAQLPA